MENGLQSIMRTKTSPIPVQKSVRRHEIKAITCLPAGKSVPLAAIPLLREDRLNACRVQLSFESMETAEVLMNAINVRVMAHFVPFLAFERFKGMDDLNRSYSGIPYEEGDDVIPFIETAAGEAHGANLVHTYLGLPVEPDQDYNTAYVEAYNLIQNFRRKNRSPDIPLRTRLQNSTLAEAFWLHRSFDHIVPDFDQAMVDGEVALNVTNGTLPVTGLYGNGSSSGNAYNPDGTVGTTARMALYGKHLTGNTWEEITAELQNDGITISLSKIEQAKQTQAFARMREAYTGLSDEYLIDLLMDGVTIPEQMWRQPILLADKSTIFGMAKRYSTDSGALTESVVSGMTGLDLMLAMPQTPTGGVIMITAEITPEQLFERRQDPFLHCTDVAQLPHYLRDILDNEKVEVVENQWVDNSHGTPTGLFGYAPLHHKWAHAGSPRVGGPKFYRPVVDEAFDENRQRIWAVETVNPTLSTDFYLCTTMHTKPFVVTNEDPFEVVLRGDAAITGNTVFGALLFEPPAGVSNYDKVAEKAPTEQIEKD